MALNEITILEDMSNEDIVKNIEEMMVCIETAELRKLKRTDVGKYRIELEKRYPHLCGRYPQIFNMVMMYERTFDMEKMKWMLQILNNRKNGEMSEQESDNAVSFRQFDEHVKPKIDYSLEREHFEKVKRGEN